MIKFQTLSQSVAPATAGEPIYTETSSASRRTHHSSSTGGRSNSIYNSSKNHKYTNIKNGLLPYEYAKDGTNIREAIELCQKAYPNVAIFRNAVDIMAVVKKNSEQAAKTVKEILPLWLARHPVESSAKSAVKFGIITAKEKRPESALKKLHKVLPEYF